MPRVKPALDADEATMLAQYLDFQRATLLWKLEGLPAEQLGARPVASTELTLAGLVKHLALVEDDWFQRIFAGNGLPEPWASAPFDEDPDWEFHSAVKDKPDELVELYEAACARSRAVVNVAATLDQSSVGRSRRGEVFTLRWILLHMIEETARHNGHADILREALDGATGE
jgi:uncharacterized damage-inducible protein DinB